MKSRNRTKADGPGESKHIEMAMPGDNVTMKIKLIYPVALENGTRFAIREGGRTVGAGTISKVVS